MSTQMTAEAVSGEPADMAAAVERVQQLQTLIARTQQAESGSATSSFAAELAAAAAGTPVAVSLAAGSNGTTTVPAELTTGSTGVPVSTSLEDSAPTPTPAALATATGSTGAPAGTSPEGGSEAYDSLIDQAAARYGLNPALLHGLIQQESDFDPNARSGAGALGLTQLMPETAASLGVTEPLNPAQSIEGGARYLSQMMTEFGGNTDDAIAAYNAGPGAVRQYGGVPPYAETQNYVSSVLAYATDYHAQTASNAVDTGTVTT